MLNRLFAMAAVVGIVFAVSLAPFIYWVGLLPSPQYSLFV